MTPFWVLQSSGGRSSAVISGGLLTLENEYIKREIGLEAGKTLSLTDGDGVQAIVSPVREGRIVIDGVCHYLEGGCTADIKPGELTEKSFDYTPKPYSTHSFPYPAPGKTAELTYSFGDIEAVIVYEIFDGMPAMRKSLYVKNNGDKTVTVNLAETEALHLSEAAEKKFYFESDYTGNNGTGFRHDTSVFHEDGIVSARFDMGPDYDIAPGETFRGMKIYELYCQSGYFESRTNEIQNMYRRVAPWVCEAPLFIHLISDNSETLRRTADNISDVGFDMIIQSFGSGIDMESEDEEYIARVKSDYDYIHSKGLTVGGYTLAIIRDYQPMNHDCATNGDHSQISRCLCTKWSEGYWNRIISFMEKTGTDFIEIDGPYHFYTCTGNRPGQTEHLHKGLSDSRYSQWLKSTIETFTRMKELGVYINAPDWLYLSGSNRCGVGYEEIGWSQPRRVQLMINRIYCYLGTYHKIPSMGWSFLPVEEYQGGGDEAKFEPLTENLDEYDWALAESAASGVWPCVRGKRLYDSELCRQVVRYWTSVIKKHRRLLNSNTIHVLPPRPTVDISVAEDIDLILQENRDTPDRLFLMVFNQTNEERTKTLVLPAFHTGLTSLERPNASPSSGRFDDVVIPNFGSWPVTYPKDLDTRTEDYSPAADSGARMALYERDMPASHREEMIDINGNLIMTVTLPPMSYTYFVGYEADGGPVDPIPVPDGKPFGLKKKESSDIKPSKILKIDQAKLDAVTDVPTILSALGLPENSNKFNGNKVILRKETYQKIHEIIHRNNKVDATNNMFNLAYIGIHTVTDKRIGTDDVWLLEGWEK